MDIDEMQSPGPVVLVGAASEDWTGDARFFEYSMAADPIGSGAINRVPIERFPASIHQDPGTRLIPLDLSIALGVGYPATSPALLAAFMVLDPGDTLTTYPDSTSELFYCIKGAGSSTFFQPTTASAPASAPASASQHAPLTAPNTGTIAWAVGDFWTLPAGCTTEHTAGPADGALIYRVTDAPLLSYLGATPGAPQFAPTRYDAATSLARLAEVEHHPDSAKRNRVSILLANSAHPQTLTVTHTMWAMLGVLPADRVQHPHRHQSVALDLILSCDPGCYTLVGSRLDDDGRIIDPIRVDWESTGAFVTPPGLWHSHHNESGAPAYLVPIQDAGLHTYLRSLDIRFASAGA